MRHFGAVNALTSIYDTQDKKQNSYWEDKVFNYSVSFCGQKNATL